MATIKRWFVRVDAQNKPVLGSLIERTKKPQEGKFVEVKFASCCTLVASAVSTTGTYRVTLKVDGVTYLTFNTAQTTATAAAAALNTAFPGIASFDGVDVTRTIIASDVTLGGRVTMEVVRA